MQRKMLARVGCGRRYEQLKQCLTHPVAGGFDSLGEIRSECKVITAVVQFSQWKHKFQHIVDQRQQFLGAASLIDIGLAQQQYNLAGPVLQQVVGFLSVAGADKASQCELQQLFTVSLAPANRSSTACMVVVVSRCAA